MPTFTAQQLIDRAKAAADMHDDFVTPEQWLAWLRVEVVDLELFIARQGYVLRETMFPITANGAETYSIPGVMAIVGVYHDDNGHLRRLRSADPFTRMRQIGTPALYKGPAREFYAAAGANDGISLSFYPRPDTGNYVVWYIAHPEGPDAVNDTVTYPLGWEERIVLRLAKRALAKEETANRHINEHLIEVDRHIEEAVWSRLLAQNPAVRNVDKVERDRADFTRWPAASEWFFP